MVLATPNASRTKVGGSHDGATMEPRWSFEGACCGSPREGTRKSSDFNALAKVIGVRKSQIKLVGGDSNRRKTFEVFDPPAGFMPVLERLLNE